MLTPIQVADWIVRYRLEAGAPVDPMSLQKLLYYAQAFRLAQHGEPLFANGFQAWRDGPVLPQVWRHYRENSVPFIQPLKGDLKTAIDPELEGGLRDTVGFFSRMTPFWLSDATHNENPWIEARRSFDEHEASAVPIPEDRIREYYAGLLWDGEEALSRQEVLDDLPEPRAASFYRAGICVRGMKRHPFYSPAWAEALARPVPQEPEFPEDLLRPIGRRDFVRARDL
jgi:uncharacterized phage-associated protein